MHKGDHTIQTVANLIVGGGIAGLWLHARAHAAGHSSQVIAPALGGGQTLLSQGIIHGGTKYALSGALTGASEAIKAMPQRWLDALAGQGEIDLSNVRLASAHQLMVHNDSLSGKITQFFASKALRGRVESVTPPAFLPANTRVYKLSEPVVDTESLIRSLAKTPGIGAGVVEKIEPESGIVTLADGSKIQAEKIFLCAGEGTEDLLTQSSLITPKMQRRPLRMLVGQGPLPELWAHIVGSGTKPLATITTHNGFWYVGGNIAEQGVNDSDFLSNASKQLQQLLPSLDLSQVSWSAVDINRAEPATENAARPDNPFVRTAGRITVAWPTKLALSPALADQVLPLFSIAHSEPLPWAAPDLALTPWSANA